MRLISVVLLSLFSSVVFAKQSFEQYLGGVKSEALEQGLQPKIVDEALGSAKLLHRSIKRDKNQPEFKVTLDSYLAKRLPAWKVAMARRYYRQHYTLLQQVGQAYGVQPRFIVALWGNETNFGSYTGNIPVISALATMAYEGRREAFFRTQLLDALKILSDKDVTLKDFKGSWAGAFGQVQFMPSAYLAYAEDYDKEGHPNIWSSLPDVFASAANYLKQNHWDPTLTWGRQIHAPSDLIEKYKGKRMLLSKWQALGFRRYDGKDLPNRDVEAKLVSPDGPKGRSYLVYSNYQSLMSWNRSNYFAISVGLLADQIIWPPLAGLPEATS
ncbi:lytic murein transglycosylase [Dongshaea marina]|uniref:lytic murein transglycosylase n=1 Tax=Dongshaea marina TaxID=2047966 RepID=UPI000D3E19AB|nr:lytic murein transglycosylase [Dongshaea marina]